MPRFLSHLLVPTLSLIVRVFFLSNAESDAASSGDNGSGLEPNG